MHDIWNPWHGCHRVSPGCENCYMYFLDEKRGQRGSRIYRTKNFDYPLQRTHTGQYRVQSGELIRVCMTSDFFLPEADPWREAVWDMMYQRRDVAFFLLTKRPERMAELVATTIGEILPNVWLGTSIEDESVVDRIEHLRRVPAAIRFISFEPLIGSVGTIDLRDIHWAIIGGESGKSARPIREEWIDEIYAQCLSANTAFFFKQWGTWGKDNKKRSKKANGREYRGRTWDEMPTTQQVVA